MRDFKGRVLTLLPAPIVWNEKPLPQSALAPLPVSAIAPRGWLSGRIAETNPRTLEERLCKAYLLQERDAINAVGADIERLLADEGSPADADILALMQYHAVTADSRVPRHLLLYAKTLRDQLEAGTAWDAARAANIGVLLHMSLWLYNLTGQKVLLELCKLIKSQAPDWMSTFHVFPQTKAVREAPPSGTDAYFRAHGATIAASLKTPALQALFEGGLKNETAFRVGWEKLTRYHGAAHGLFNADPLLAGGSPSRQVAPETVREMIGTLKTLLWTSGDPAIGDWLDTIVYNALPAARGMQAANQLTPAEGDNPIGAAQFAASLWMATQDGGLAAIGYAPCEARWRIAGQTVRVSVDTTYPYGETVTIKLHLKTPAQFPLHLRIPAWADGATAQVAGDEPIACGQGFAIIDRPWQNGDQLTLTLPMQIKTVQRYHQSISVQRGPLTFALPVEKGTQWNLALLPERGFQLNAEGEMPVILAHGAPVEDWRARDKKPAPPPISPIVSAAEVREIRLVPYGETRARIAQFPAGTL